MKRTVALGDVHLTRGTPAHVGRDVARFFDVHRGQRVLFTGDVLDLSADAPHAETKRAHERVLAHPEVARAMAEHLDAGGELFWVAGNHDAAVGSEGFASRLAESLGVRGDAAARLHASPWFFRLGGVHLEHGHRFDPDNAPAHPLAEGPSLGVTFVEEFIVPTGAHAYLNANDGTPLDLFLSSFKWYGPRAPYVIARFFTTAASALKKSGKGFDVASQVHRGSEKQAHFASIHAMSDSEIEALLDLGATPTLVDRRDTFSRLYLDRVAATLAILGGSAAFLSGRRKTGAAVVALGGLIMAASWARGHDRYGGAVTERLADGAGKIAALTGDPLVVFGHTHHQTAMGAYANPGSFAFVKEAPGRPFLEIEDADTAKPRAVLRHFS